jgi:transcription elongation factor Elf1
VSRLTARLDRLDPCPKCGAREWDDPIDLFIRNMVECKACGIRIRCELLEPEP